MQALWKDREKRIVNLQLFSEEAEKLASQIGARARNSSRDKQSQIRRFYDEVIRLNSRATARPNEWENIKPLVYMLTAKAAYARGRNLISDEFLKFIKDYVNQIEEPEDLNVFSNFFEAFMGYYKLHGPRN